VPRARSTSTRQPTPAPSAPCVRTRWTQAPDLAQVDHASQAGRLQRLDLAVVVGKRVAATHDVAMAEQAQEDTVTRSGGRRHSPFELAPNCAPVVNLRPRLVALGLFEEPAAPLGPLRAAEHSQRSRGAAAGRGRLRLARHRPGRLDDRRCQSRRSKTGGRRRGCGPASYGVAAGRLPRIKTT
jgi:hypothetical protein